MPISCSTSGSSTCWPRSFGTVQGGVQALSRSYFARLIPRERAGEYFGFYNMLAKFAAVLGPLAMGVVAIATGNQRLSILVLECSSSAGRCCWRACATRTWCGSRLASAAAAAATSARRAETLAAPRRRPTAVAQPRVAPRQRGERGRRVPGARGPTRAA